MRARVRGLMLGAVLLVSGASGYAQPWAPRPRVEPTVPMTMPAEVFARLRAGLHSDDLAVRRSSAACLTSIAEAASRGSVAPGSVPSWLQGTTRRLTRDADPLVALASAQCLTALELLPPAVPAEVRLSPDAEEALSRCLASPDQEVRGAGADCLVLLTVGGGGRPGRLAGGMLGSPHLLSDGLIRRIAERARVEEDPPLAGALSSVLARLAAEEDRGTRQGGVVLEAAIGVLVDGTPVARAAMAHGLMSVCSLARGDLVSPFGAGWAGIAPLLEALRSDPEPMVRKAILEPLFSRAPDSPPTEEALMAVVRSDPAPELRRLAAEAICRLGETQTGTMPARGGMLPEASRSLMEPGQPQGGPRVTIAQQLLQECLSDGASPPLMTVSLPALARRFAPPEAMLEPLRALVTRGAPETAPAAAALIAASPRRTDGDQAAVLSLLSASPEGESAELLLLAVRRWCLRPELRQVVLMDGDRGTGREVGPGEPRPFLQHPDPRVRAEALAALSSQRPNQAAAASGEAALSDADPQVRLRAVALVGPGKLTEVARHDTDAIVRCAALDRIAATAPGADTLELVADSLGDPDPVVRARACLAAQRVQVTGPRGSDGPVLGAMGSAGRDGPVRERLEALLVSLLEDTAPAVVELPQRNPGTYLGAEPPNSIATVREAAVTALVDLLPPGDGTLARVAARFLGDESPYMAELAFRALRSSGAAASIDGFDAPEPRRRRAALTAVRRIGAPAALYTSRVAGLLDDPDRGVRLEAVRTLDGLGVAAVTLLPKLTAMLATGDVEMDLAVCVTIETILAPPAAWDPYPEAHHIM